MCIFSSPNLKSCVLNLLPAMFEYILWWLRSMYKVLFIILQHHCGNLTFRPQILCTFSKLIQGTKILDSWSEQTFVHFYTLHSFTMKQTFWFHKIFMLFTKKAKRWTVMILKGSQGQNSFKNPTWSLLNVILIYLFYYCCYNPCW